MKVYLSASFLVPLIQSDKKETLKNLLLTSIDSNTRFFTSTHSIHIVFSNLGVMNVEKKKMILRNLEDLCDQIFPISMDEIRSELLLTDGLGLEQVSALNEGMDEFYHYGKDELVVHPLLKIRNFFRETN
ncbi:hypothetical protein EHR04_05710 [Leptospira levettii]|uniref:Uncharacterized protein n=1 Tax=Leptospira levettii TaxID=2023178 RepID=A0ABY2MP04_9LEPT|nr:hypothetical protein [Leptospira levettii]MCW7475343.1 hypothetical protein [Leptospira levettii]PJZ36582.1 hypothetical protein CH354_13445 [Leptospira levettii]PJZ99583.1 hypothetical protein CH369_14005 [Leptospira levettii]TGL06755.1 hypothetical protein EHQ39_14720 [Leptospira levettii]TGL10922.1 hypothetical protein EHQ42_16125 [Leptospira levettii]